ncbi:MAG: EAL domain-containing protein, partial [Butyrivibrio sp.]|nr:EAL domain-containing protein [Butyrivibrio sp.]
YQPIINVKDDSIFGYEALMRPMPFSPMEFINELTKRDKLQLVEEITNYYGVKYFLETGLEGKLFINTFPSTCMRLEVSAAVAELGGTTMIGRVVYEILEYTTKNRFAYNIKRTAINESNVQALIAIDDYGTGSNYDLECIDFYKPDLVKIDREIISDIDRDTVKQEILEQMCYDMQSRNIKLLAEGVETQEEYNYLKMQPIDYMQGYFLGKPKLYTEYIKEEVK